MKFKDGEEVQGICFSDDSIIKVGEGPCDNITVSMENGQMAEVPWFEVWVDGKVISKWNGAQIDGVLFE
ncbi:MAG: hypothetical protein GY951_18420 [Psychromonas sp.]|nr:hypothetical protein [Psychromonas sp.]